MVTHTECRIYYILRQASLKECYETKYNVLAFAGVIN